MSLENNLYVPENVGFYNEQTVFTVVSQNAGVTAEFTNDESNTILLTTNRTEDNSSTSFAIRNTNNTLSISRDLNTPIIDISDENLYVNRDLYFLKLFPQEDTYTQIGSKENPINYVYTEQIFIDNYTVFTKNGELYKRYEPTGHTTKIMTEQIESIRWKHIQNMNNVVYLDADLIIDNDVYLKGSLTSNIDMSSFIVDNTKIDMYSVGFGKLDNPNIKAHGDTVIINDAWKISHNNSMFSSKTVIVNGNVYIRGKIHYDPIITSYRIKQYSIQEIGFGNTDWCNINDAFYTSRPVWIDGDILTSGTIQNMDIMFDIDTSSSQIYYPTEKAIAQTVNIVDKTIINQHKTVVQNVDDLELRAKALLLHANSIHLDGDVSINPRNTDLFKEIFEHSAIYNSMDLMQKRYTFTGQIPIRKGYKHEVGYYITWSATPTPFNIFELRGNFFMADTIREIAGGLRVKGSFSLSINPFDNGDDLPNMDKLFEYNNGKTKQIVSEKGIRLQVTKITGKNVKLSLDWETDQEYREEYHAHINIDAHIPGFLGKRMVFTPFHNILAGAENSYDTKAFFADQYPKVNNNLDYRPAALPGGIVEDLIISGRKGVSSLIVEKPSVNTDTRTIAEFWDKTDYKQYENDDDCVINHHNKVPRGIRIERDGQMFIGYPQYQDTDINYDEEAQVNIKADNENYRMKIEGKYNKTIFDKNGNLIINNKKPFNDRVQLSNTVIDEYALDVTGNVSIRGAVNINNNQIIRGMFNISNKSENTFNNTLKIYVTWALEQNLIIESNNNIIISIFYNVSSFNTDSISVSSQEIDMIIDPRNNNIDKPNSILTMFKSGVYSQLYSNISVDTNRLDDNAVLVEITTHGKYKSDNISYASITMVGSEVFYQFTVESELTYYGIQELEDIDDLYLTLTHVPYDVNLYDLYGITNRKEAYFEIDGAYDSNMYYIDEDYQLFITPNIRDIDYTFSINAYNKRGVLLNSNLHVHVNELPPVSLIGTSNIYLGDIIINKYPEKVYHYYDISQKYSWSEMSNYMFFDTRFEVIDDEIQIDAKLSGRQYTVDVALYYKGTNTIDHALLDNNLTIYYNELVRIVLKDEYDSSTINITSNTTVDLYDYFNVSSNVTFAITHYDGTSNVLDSSHITIFDDMTITAYYHGFIEYTSNVDLSFKVEHIETIHDEPIDMGWHVKDRLYLYMWDYFDVTARLDEDRVDFLISSIHIDNVIDTSNCNMSFTTIDIKNEDYLEIITDERGIEYTVTILANYVGNSRYNNSISFKIKEVPLLIEMSKIISVDDIILDDIRCNLIDYYNVKDYNESIQELVKFEVIDKNSCNNTVVERDQKLEFKGAMRGETYDVDVLAYYSNFKDETSNTNLTFRITEVPPITEKSTQINVGPILDRLTLTCNMFDYFNIAESNYHLVSFSSNNVNNCNINVTINDSSNLVITSDQRGSLYNIELHAVYSRFASQTLNSNVNITIDEVIDIATLSGQATEVVVSNLIVNDVTCNLFDYYNIRDRHRGLVSFTSNDVNSCNDAIDVTIQNGSNLVISPEQRGSTYNIQINAFYTGYEDTTIDNNLTFKINEVPKIETTT